MRGSAVVAAALLLASAGCSSSATLQRSLAETTQERDALLAEKAELQRQVAQLRAALDKAAPETAAPVQARPAVNPGELAKPWVADATQLRDAGKREAAIAAIRDALASSDPTRAAAGLIAVPQIANVQYDKAALHDLVLRHAQSADAATRAGVPFALLNSGGPRPGDEEVVTTLSTDWAPAVRDCAGRSLVFFTKYDLTGPAGERVLGLLDDPDKQVRRDVLASIWGSRVSPAIEAKLLERFHGEDPKSRHDAFYFGLSTLKEKSPAVVDACIEAMESPDSELQWRARWGLAQGVADDLRGRVSDSYLRLLFARSDTQLEQDAFQWLRRYGTDANAAELERLAKGELVADSTKAAALETASAIKSHAPR